MSHARKRWIVIILACLAALVCRPLMQQVQSLDGGAGISVLLSPGIGMALAITLAVLLIAAAVGVVAARFCGPHVGLLAAGLPLVWVSLGMGTIADLLKAGEALDRSGASVLWTLTIETALLGVAVCLIAYLVYLASPDQWRRDVSAPGNAASGIGVLIALVVAGVGVWIIARSELPGQVLAACWIGGILGGLAARVAAPTASTLAFVLGIVLLGVIGQIAGAVTDGPQALAEANAGRLWELSRPLPLTYAAAALVAAPMGSAWGRSLTSQVHHERSHKGPGTT
ncbi:MAG: hypothetical protein ACF8NJ_11385 [Phycisphaerales bacterium JB038]